MPDRSGRAFGRDALLAAFDRIGRAAAAEGVMLDLLLYGGAALMLASNFRFATEDVDIAEIGRPWPEWLKREVESVTSDFGWAEEWLNDAVQFHLSPIANRAADHQEFGTFPRCGTPGLRVSVPSLNYMLALKLKAMRINDPVKGPMERTDIQQLIRAGGVQSIDQAIAILGQFFPRSARDADKQRLYLKYIWPTQEADDGAPQYPLRRG